MVNLFIAIILFLSCNEQPLYENAYHFIVENYSEELLDYLQEESNNKSDQELKIHISKEIVPLESVFFDDQINVLKEWPVFSNVKDIKNYLWEYNSKQVISSNLMEYEINDQELSKSNLIMFLSEEYEELLLVDVIWLPSSVKEDISYDKLANFGRSIRFLLEIDSQKNILNAVNTFVHHN